MVRLVSMPSPLLLTRNERFTELVERAKRVSEVSFDCEFHGEKRYRPTLYLVQIGVEGEFVAVNPSTVDLKPLRVVLENERIRKLFHAGREDVRLLARATRAKEVAGVFDTQIAAAFLGYGLTVGYARLVKELLDVDLDKSHQFTDWSRDLTTEQVEYALNDVRYLPKTAALLQAALESRGRLGWALDASRTASLAALIDPDPRRLYREISGFAKLTEIELGRLRELAMWRDAVAESENCRPDGASRMRRRLEAARARSPGETLAASEGMRGLGIGASERWWTGLPRRPRARHRPARAGPAPRSKPMRAWNRSRCCWARCDASLPPNRISRPELLASSAELRTLAEWQLGTPRFAPPRARSPHRLEETSY